jgi:cholesterol oxidase
MITGRNIGQRVFRLVLDFFRNPADNLMAYSVGNWADRTQILLFMQTIDSTLQLKKGFFGLRTSTGKGQRPSAFIPEAQELARKYAEIVDGKPLVLPTESLFGIPSTAHILGGCCMGDGPETGVISHDHKVFGYNNLFVMDGSVISANPGVNPSLTIAALAERFVTTIPDRKG